jgi:hypothetical protein
VNVEERELRTLATEFGPVVFKRLIRLCASQNESVAVRACEAVLDRAYGKPPQAVELTGDMPPVVVTRASREDVARALEQLRAQAPELIAHWGPAQTNGHPGAQTNGHASCPGGDA